MQCPVNIAGIFFLMYFCPKTFILKVHCLFYIENMLTLISLIVLTFCIFFLFEIFHVVYAGDLFNNVCIDGMFNSTGCFVHSFIL